MPNNYTRARSDYLEWYSHLISAPDPQESPDPISASDLLANRIEGLNFAAEELIQASLPYLHDEDSHTRSVTLDSLLAQIAGELEVANVLWEVIEESENEEDNDSVVTRSLRGNKLADSLRRLANDLPRDLENIPEPSKRSAPEFFPSDLESARQELAFEIRETIHLIQDRTQSIGLRLTRDTLLLGQNNWGAVLKALDLLHGQERVGNVGWGLEDEVKKVSRELASSLRGLLVNVVSRVLLVIQHNDLIRYTLAGWLDDLKNSDPEERRSLFQKLLEQLYQTDPFQNHDLPIWLRDCTDLKALHQATESVVQLGDQFDQLSNQVKRLSSLLGIGVLFAHPTLISVGFALQIGLLGTFVFAGYDYLDEGARALNITRGIKEILIEDLPVSSKTRQEALNLRTRRVRN